MGHTAHVIDIEASLIFTVTVRISEKVGLNKIMHEYASDIELRI